MPEDSADIKIFVSRRIDIDSVTVPNPLYIPVRCGAVYDENDNSPYAGDDTGENISEKRMTFCEFTVQYWAWKNQQADYYGLCHYRRYLSFAEKRFRTGAHGLVMEPLLDEKSMQRYGLLDEGRMRREIENYDLIMPSRTPVSQIFVPHGRAHNVRELWDAHVGYFFSDGVIDRMFRLIDELVPEYSISAREYFAGSVHIGYNCYIMRRELFDRLCRLQFPVMEALERELQGTESLNEYSRTVAYIGEILFGVFIYHVTTKEHWRYSVNQIIMFKETLPVNSRAEWLQCHISHVIDNFLWKTTLWIFPLGTKKREMAKSFYLKLKNK